MSIKALFLDLDGTSLNDNHELSPRLVAVLNALHTKGLEIVFCTGRGYIGSKAYVDQLGFCNFVVNYNAARILNLNTNTLLHEASLSLEAIKKIFHFAQQYAISPSFYHNDIFYTQEISDDLIFYRELTGEQYQLFDHKSELIDLTITKALFIIPAETMTDTMEKAHHYFDDASVYSSSDTYLDIMPKGITKAVGVQKIIKQLAISPEECMAFGDQWNDYEMLNFVGKGYLMGNAPEDLKKAFPESQHVLSNTEDGVAIQLEQFFNKRDVYGNL